MMNDESDITVLLNKEIVLSIQAEKKESPLEYELFADLFLEVRAFHSKSWYILYLFLKLGITIIKCSPIFAFVR